MLPACPLSRCTRLSHDALVLQKLETHVGLTAVPVLNTRGAASKAGTVVYHVASRGENSVYQLMDRIADADASGFGVVQHEAKRAASQTAWYGQSNKGRYMFVPGTFLEKIVVLAVNIQGVA